MLIDVVIYIFCHVILSGRAKYESIKSSTNKYKIERSLKELVRFIYQRLSRIIRSIDKHIPSPCLISFPEDTSNKMLWLVQSLLHVNCSRMNTFISVLPRLDSANVEASIFTNRSLFMHNTHTCAPLLPKITFLFCTQRLQRKVIWPELKTSSGYLTMCYARAPRKNRRFW